MMSSRCSSRRGFLAKADAEQVEQAFGDRLEARLEPPFAGR